MIQNICCFDSKHSHFHNFTFTPVPRVVSPHFHALSHYYTHTNPYSPAKVSLVTVPSTAAPLELPEPWTSQPTMPRMLLYRSDAYRLSNTTAHTASTPCAPGRDTAVTRTCKHSDIKFQKVKDCISLFLFECFLFLNLLFFSCFLPMFVL